MPSYEELASRLRTSWRMMSWRPIGDLPRTAVIVHSISVHITPRWQPLLPAYEERFLCYLLGLTSPRSHVVYVTSMPIHPRLLDYWFGLVPGLDTPANRARLTLIPVVDARSVPLTRKVLDHPGTVRRIREAVPDPDWAVMLGHTVTDDDIALSRLLGVPLYGIHPRFARWGTKSGGRAAFEAAGVPVAPGVSGVRSTADVTAAIEQLVADDPGLDSVIVKLDEGASGIGNGTIRLTPGRPISEAWRDIELEEPERDAEEYYEHLAREGGVVEAFVRAEEVRSPSVQLRIAPDGQCEVLSTHEQILGGRHGLSYLGCDLPARPEYAAALARDGLAVAELLAGEGVVGRLAIDFLAVRRGSGWSTYALEINLRHGGTTHTLATLSSLTHGDYDVAAGTFCSANGIPKYYRASDHLARESYVALTTDDLLDAVPRAGLAWNAETQTGPILHMASAIAGTGTVGVTAIGDTPEEAVSIFDRTRDALDEAARRLG